MTEGLMRLLTVIVAGAATSAATYGLLGDATDPPEIEPGPFLDRFAHCVDDGNCAGAPPANCPAWAQAGYDCWMCQHQRQKQRCDLHLLKNCAWYDHTGFATDCGDRWEGVCDGPNLPCAGGLDPVGRCGRITCADAGR